MTRILILLLLTLPSPVLAQQSYGALTQTIQTNLPANNTNSINALALQSVLQTMNQSYCNVLYCLMQGKLQLIPTTGGVSGLNIGISTTAPTSPINGDLWATNSGLFFEYGGVAYPIATTPTNVVTLLNGIVGAVAPGGTWTFANPTTFNGQQTVANNQQCILGGSSGVICFNSSNVTASNYYLTLPSATDTLVARSTSETLSNKTVSGSSTWNGNTVGAAYGGTGVNNGASTLTLGASLITTGPGAPTLAFPTLSYTYTFPGANGILAEVGLAQTWSAIQTFTQINFATLWASSTAPTISSGFCTASIGVANGTKVFTISTGAGACSSTGVISLSTAANGWFCQANDLTVPTTNVIRQSASATNSATLTDYTNAGAAQNFTVSHTLQVTCDAY